jgi:S-formylglutathione hydrolase FrmB
VAEGTVQDASVYLHADRLRSSGSPQPVITFDCGVDDELIQHNRDFDAHMTRIGLNHTYAEHSGGHTWEYWNEHIQAAIDQHARVLGIESTKPVNGN